MVNYNVKAESETRVNTLKLPGSAPAHISKVNKDRVHCPKSCTCWTKCSRQVHANSIQDYRDDWWYVSWSTFFSVLIKTKIDMVDNQIWLFWSTLIMKPFLINFFTCSRLVVYIESPNLEQAVSIPVTYPKRVKS